MQLCSIHTSTSVGSCQIMHKYVLKISFEQLKITLICNLCFFIKFCHHSSVHCIDIERKKSGVSIWCKRWHRNKPSVQYLALSSNQSYVVFTSGPTPVQTDPGLQLQYTSPLSCLTLPSYLSMNPCLETGGLYGKGSTWRPVQYCTRVQLPRYERP